ncbi:MAG: hypothetical protein U0736_09230 [Gemmataceae bacterium]
MTPSFPTTRLRRPRHHLLVRELVRETTLSPADLILPLFVRPGRGACATRSRRLGNYQLLVDTLVDEVVCALDLGVRARSCSSVSRRTRTRISAVALEDGAGGTSAALRAPHSLWR